MFLRAKSPMLRLNFHLMGVIDPEAEQPKFLRQDHFKAFRCVLANVKKYGQQPIFYSRRNQPNRPPRYNPAGLGNKPVRYVIDRLDELGLLTVTKGFKRYEVQEDYELIPSRMSSFVASCEMVEMAHRLIPSKQLYEAQQPHIELRDLKENLVNFEWNDYLSEIHFQMAEYCDYINKQFIVIRGERLTNFHLARKFKDWNEDGSFMFDGRAWHPFMNMSPEERVKNIRINGSDVVALDYAASEPNLLYQMMTGQRLFPDGDPYTVEGLERWVVKRFMTLMLNTKDERGASSAMKNWLNEDERNVLPHRKMKEKADKVLVEQAIQQYGSIEKIIRMIVEKNKPIESCLMQGKRMGQHYQWLEASLVFHVAHQLMLSNVPALTVHDEFIVRKQDAPLAEMVMYGTWPEGLPKLTDAPWNRSRQTKSEAY
jgi:hypothetical protein